MGNTQTNETDLLIEKKEKSYETTKEYQRPPSRLVWAESSCIRWIYVLFWWWVYPLVKLSSKKTLTDEDLEDLPASDRCSTLLHKISETGDSTKKSLWSIIFRSFWKQFLITGLILMPYIAARIGQPILLRKIVFFIADYQSDVPTSPVTGYLYALGLFLCVLAQLLVHHQYFFRCMRGGVSMHNALTLFLYKHLLSVNTASLNKLTRAQKVNIVAQNLTKFDDLIVYFHVLWDAPVEAIIIFVLLACIFPVLPIFFGYLVLFLIIAIQVIVTRLLRGYEDPAKTWTDKRIEAFGELVTECRLIKINGWERPMIRRVLEKRQQEFASIRRVSYLRALNMSLVSATQPLVAIAVFGSAFLLGYELVSVDVFTVLAFFAQLRMPVTYFLPRALINMTSIRLTVKQIATFMQLETIPSTQVPPESPDSATNVERGTIVIQNASFSWPGHDACLSSIDMNIPPGAFIGITGPLGAGKSSLLSAILGEMNTVSGRVDVNGSSFSYAAQSPWIFADTLRANILFGNLYDEQRYSSVLKACCLDVDLSVFGPSGDLILIGEKGVNLSHGQRSRIALARALYADADIYLFDDPLVAVDARVAKRIYTQCLGPEGLLSKKTRLLVTHQARYLAGVDQIVYIEHGHIQVSDGPCQPSPTYTRIEDQDDSQNEDAEMISLLDIIQKSNIDKESIVCEEPLATGNVSGSVWAKLFTAPPLRWIGFIFLVLILMLGEAFYDMTNIWLYQWSSQKPQGQQRPEFPSIYLVLVFVTLSLALSRAYFTFFHILRGSEMLHNKMVTALAYTRMQFFENNPIGRILNRATEDQHVLDEVFPVTFLDASQSLLMTAGAIIITGCINWLVLLILIPVIPLCIVLIYFYLKCSRQLKRLENIARSPILSFFESSLNGLATIRAFKAKDEFIRLFMNKIDAKTRSSISRIAVSHWFAFRLDIMTSLFILVTALLSIVFCQNINPTLVAFSLIYAISMVASFQWGIRQICEAENLMISTERINEYAQLPPEEEESARENILETSSKWLHDGKIEFRNYSLNYRATSRTALKNINMLIEPREKVGVIGRTGAGKSSLFNSILRLVDHSDCDGEILIDDVNIAHVTLRSLRSHISVIPQQCMLFGDTLRFNLDPSDQYSDEECLIALDAVQLKKMVSTHPDGLLLPIVTEGANLSASQAQLICVARAILRRSKILLIDEATAHVNAETDRLFQQAIADKFQDRTVLTIAHRLGTVAKYNRIVVLDNGTVIDSDTPAVILTKYH